MGKLAFTTVASVLALTTIMSGLTAYYYAQASMGVVLAYLDTHGIPWQARGLLNMLGFSFYASLAVFVIQVIGLAVLVWYRKSWFARR